MGKTRGLVIFARAIGELRYQPNSKVAANRVIRALFGEEGGVPSMP